MNQSVDLSQKSRLLKDCFSMSQPYINPSEQQLQNGNEKRLNAVFSVNQEP